MIPSFVRSTRYRSWQLPLLTAALIFVASQMTNANGGKTPRPIPSSALGRITVERAKAHVDYLAADRMLGRNTPSPGLDSAAEYIAAEFRRLGVEPVGGSYFHTYSLMRDRLGEKNSLRVGGKEFGIKSDFTLYEFSGADTLSSAEVVFVGYGIVDSALGYDDYAGIDARGKVVVAIHGEPSALGNRRGGRRVTVPSATKMATASAHGAKALFLIANPYGTTRVRPAMVIWPELYPNLPAESFPLRLDLSRQRSIPTFSIGDNVLTAIWGEPLARIGAAVRRIDTSGRPGSIALRGRVDLVSSVAHEPVVVRNVIGVVPGSGSVEEYVVIGAHYDHVGHLTNLAGATPMADSIYNGADDNASGTAGLLMVAEAVASLPRSERPRRGMLFIAFSGEEKGLYGSRAYVADPSIPNERSVAMVNMDMIGRNSPDSIYVGGVSRSPELKEAVEKANADEPLSIGYGIEEYFGRSDQASFAAKRIPVLFFWSGEHPDYHGLGDGPEKVDNRKIAHVARLALRSAWRVADAETRPTYVVPGR